MSVGKKYKLHELIGRRMVIRYKNGAIIEGILAGTKSGWIVRLTNARITVPMKRVNVPYPELVLVLDQLLRVVHFDKVTNKKLATHAHATKKGQDRRQFGDWED